MRRAVFGLGADMNGGLVPGVVFGVFAFAFVFFGDFPGVFGFGGGGDGRGMPGKGTGAGLGDFARKLPPGGTPGGSGFDRFFFFFCATG